ncbi:MAG: YceI family protein [Bacteroidota bacterium]
MIYKSSTTLVLMMMLQAIACSQLQPGWQLDVQKSKVLWNTGKMMGGHFGYFLFQSGNLEYSATGEPVRGTFHMDMNSIRTTDNPNEAGRKKKDAELRGNAFFASDQHSLATMVVKKITRIGSSMNYNVAGDLTIKDITKPIEFTAIINTKNNTSHITANVDISHQLWNINSKPQANSIDFLLGIKEKLVPDIHVSLDLIMNK